jgi:hypothetical protein
VFSKNFFAWQRKKAFQHSYRSAGGVKMKRASKADVIRKMCNIQKELDDTVVFTVGIRDKGRIIDIISMENLLQSRRSKPEEQMQVQLPEVPDYVG